MCSGRVDLEHILRAFSNGADGVFIGGCRLNECNYITHGNYDAWANVYVCKKIMGHIGIHPERADPNRDGPRRGRPRRSASKPCVRLSPHTAPQ